MSEKKPNKRAGLFEPVFAMVGATELATNALRQLGADKERAQFVGEESDAKPSLIARLRGDVTDIVRGTTRVPSVAAEELRTRYAELAERGQQTVTSAVPVVKKARRDGEETVRSEEAKARREARRLARQAGETVTRGRTIAASAADDAAKVAERTFEAVRTEAGQVVDSVTRPGRIKRHAPRDAAARRRSAVVDTAVTSTSPIGGDPNARTELAGAGGVEAAAATIGRRGRKNTAPATDEDRPASRPTLTRRAAAQSGSTTPDPTTIVAKKARAKAADTVDEGSEKVWTSETPSPSESKVASTEAPKAETSEKQERTDTSERTEDTQHSNESKSHSDIPTPAEVAKVIEGSHDEA